MSAGVVQGAKWLLANPEIVKAANGYINGVLTPPRTPRKKGGRRVPRTRTQARRRLNMYSAPRQRLQTSIKRMMLGRGSGGLSRGGASKRPRRRAPGSNFFEAKEFVSFEKGTKANVHIDKKYHMYGYVDTKEVTGQINDPDCVYLGHSAQVNESTMYCLVRALIRKLLRKTVAFDGVSASFEVPGYLFDDTGTVYKIVLLQKNLDTDAITVKTTWFSTGNDTITSIAQAFVNDFINYSNGFALYSASYKQELFKFQVYIKDGNITDFWNFQGELNLEDLKIHVKAKSQLKLQNRTKGADSSADGQDVTNNPLIGRTYYMNNLPKVRDDVGRFSSMNKYGVELIRAAELPAASMLSEPPKPGYFVNCKKSAVVKVMPGQIKYSTLVFEKEMKFLKFLKTMRWDEDADSISHYNIGPYELIALEDAINVNSTEKIVIAYEINRTTAVYFTEKHLAYSQGVYSTNSVSNTT